MTQSKKTYIYGSNEVNLENSQYTTWYIAYGIIGIVDADTDMLVSSLIESIYMGLVDIE